MKTLHIKKPMDKLTKEEIIARVRKTRVQLWDEKISFNKDHPMKIPHSKKAFKPDYEKAWRSFDRIRDRLKQHGSPLDSLSKEEIIQRLRKTRVHLWEDKFASRS